MDADKTAKRGPGRPRKDLASNEFKTGEEATKPTKPVSQPESASILSKSRAWDPTGVASDPPKRGRGRPPKINQAHDSTRVASDPPKRGRGRPRKVLAPVEEPAKRILQAQSSPPPDAEIGGRPSEILKDEAGKEAKGNRNRETAPKKRRGRPKKVHYPVELNAAEPKAASALPVDTKLFDILSKNSKQIIEKNSDKEENQNIGQANGRKKPPNKPNQVEAVEAQVPKPRVVPPIVKPDLFETLANTLEMQSAKLSAGEAKHEKELRPKIVKCLKDVSADERELGQLLFEYRAVYKGGRQWTNIATQIGKLIDRSSRTIYRMVDQYEASQKSVLLNDDQTEAFRIDSIEMTAQEKAEVAARLAIRVCLNELPKINDKLRALARLLSEEAYQIWGNRDSFSIKIAPTPSRFTIDGRKKRVKQAEEALA